MGEEYSDIAYEPTKECGELSEEVDKKIRDTYYSLYKFLFYQWEKKMGGTETLKVSFYGEYNGAYAVQIYCNLWEAPDDWYNKWWWWWQTYDYDKIIVFRESNFNQPR